jgi:hypothetical protein
MLFNAQRIKRVEAEPTHDAFSASPLLALSFVGFMFSEVFKGFCLVISLLPRPADPLSVRASLVYWEFKKLFFVSVLLKH